MSDEKRAFDLDFLSEPAATASGQDGRSFDVAVEGDGLRKTMRTTICGIKIERKWRWSKDYGKHFGSQMRRQFESPPPHKTENRNVKYVAVEWAKWAARQAGIELDETYRWPTVIWCNEAHGGYRVRGVRTYTKEGNTVTIFLPSYWNWGPEKVLREDGTVIEVPGVRVSMPKKPRRKKSSTAELLVRMNTSS